MRITVSQKEKNLEIVFSDKKLEKSFAIDKADEFLECVDKLAGKNRMELKALQNVRLEFCDVGLLTERIVRVIMLGLSFNS